jgi:hypothetical protein
MTKLTALLKQYREGQRDMPTYAELVVFATEMDVMETQLKNAQGVIVKGLEKTICQAEYNKGYKDGLHEAFT